MRRALAVLFAAAGLAVVMASPAGAHALVRRSVPAAGAILQQPPPQVVITFTEPPDPVLSFVHVLNTAGKEVESGKSAPVPGQPLDMRVPLPTLTRGVYTVTWRTVSRVDGHVTGGSFSFGVGVAPGVATSTGGVETPTTPSPSAAAVAGRWAFDWGLLLLLGAAGSVLFVFRELPRGGRGLVAGSWALAAAGLVTMTLAERSSVGISLSALLLHSGVGREFLRRGVVLAVVGGAVGLALWRPGRASFLTVGVTASAAMLVHALAGHAGASGRFEWFNVGVQWVHLLAVGLWVGGLGWLLLGTRGAAPGRGEAVKRFSWMAGVALAAVAVTGALRAVDEVGGPSDWRRLLDTSFGIALLVKIGLFAGLVSLGAVNRYVNVPLVGANRDRATPLRRTVGAEVLVAIGILGATAVLSELPPASTIAAAAPKAAAPQLVVSGSDFGTTTRVRLAVAPGTVGPNRFDARVTDFDTGRPAEATAVSLQFSLRGHPDLGTPTVGLVRTAGGDWTGQSTVLSIGGTWDVSVVVQRSGGGVTVPLRVQTLLPPEQITVSRVPGQPTLYTIALSEGGSLQTYVDPAMPGRINQVHFTFFQPSGAELPIASATATATPPGGEAAPMKLIRFDPGHFVANQTLAAGPWRFEVQATTRDGRVIDAYFDQQIGT